MIIFLASYPLIFFSLGTLHIPIFIKTILSVTAMQNRLTSMISLYRVAHTNIHMCGCNFNTKGKLASGNLLKKVLEMKKILEKSGKFDSQKKWEPWMSSFRVILTHANYGKNCGIFLSHCCAFCISAEEEEKYFSWCFWYKRRPHTYAKTGPQ